MKMISAHMKTHVEQIKEIVTLMMNVRMVFFVDQTIVQNPLAFILNLIAVMSHLWEMKIFVHQLILVLLMKEIVILTMNALITFFVILQVVVQHIWDLYLI